MRLAVVALVLASVACGGGPAAPPPRAVAPSIQDDLHRRLTAEECGQLHDVMRERGWLVESEAPRETIVANCVETPQATKAFFDCMMAAGTREDSARCL